MAEQEFDVYLDLLGRFLKLSPEQRESIADELRDHLEARLEELVAAGYEREEALRAALDEFGAAADLADHFTRIARRQRRRTLMRYTAGSSIAAVLVIALVWTSWPSNQNTHSNNGALANTIEPFQPEGSGVKKPKPTKKADKPEKTSRKVKDPVRKLEERLQIPIDEVKFKETPLSDALDFISQLVEADIIFDKKGIDGIGVDGDELITLQFKFAKPKAETVLRLILEPLELTFSAREGFIIITSKESGDAEVATQLYDCRDLLVGLGPMKRKPKLPAGFGGDLAGGKLEEISAEERLIDVIQSGTTSEVWKDQGGPATITSFRGVLVLRGPQALHHDVDQLLTNLRGTLKDELGRPKNNRGGDPVGGPSNFGGPGADPGSGAPIRPRNPRAGGPAPGDFKPPRDNSAFGGPKRKPSRGSNPFNDPTRKPR